MRMRREACHNGLARIGQVVREGGHFVAVHPGVDEQHASPAVHDNGVALAELALVDQHTLRDLPQHGCKATVPSARQHRVNVSEGRIAWCGAWVRPAGSGRPIGITGIWDSVEAVADVGMDASMVRSGVALQAAAPR